MVDARHERPRIGRIFVSHRGDATDRSITTRFGPAPLAGFAVGADAVVGTA